MSNNFLILDLETDSLDIKKANIKWIGMYSGNTKKYEILPYNEKNKRLLMNRIFKHKFIITYNGDNFDIPILLNHKIISKQHLFKNKHLYKSIDLYQLTKKRATLIFAEGFESLKLKHVIKKLFPNDNEEKDDIDYSIFYKNYENLTNIEKEKIKKYLKKDLYLTKKLWNFFIEKFEPFKEFIKKEDVEKLYHIKASSATYGYKAICYKANINEEWGDNSDADKYEGAFVMLPSKEKSIGNILYLDFASLYPMIYVHNNLFSFNCDCCLDEEKWNGNNMWKIDGKYCSKKQGKIEEAIKEFFLLRKKYKKNKDSRQQAIKIILNSLYGASSRPAFKQIYSKTTASDCTSLGQQIIKYSISEIEKNGFGKALMADTDSVVLEISKNKTKEECLNFVKNLSKKISDSFPFPWEEFNLKLEDELKYIQFFKGKSNDLNKKFYLYVNKNDKLVIKGLDIIQKNCSKLSKKIFYNYLKQQIIKNLNCKFDKNYIDNLINKEIEIDKTIIAKSFNIKPLKDYKSLTSIYYQIGQIYGEGEINLIKNNKIGSGKNVKYCSIEESKNLNIKDLNLDDVYKELRFFIK